MMARNPDRDPFGPWMNGFTWDMAFDGRTWELCKGEDFDNAPGTVVGKVRDEAAKRFGRLDVHVDGDRVFVRYTPAGLVR